MSQLIVLFVGLAVQPEPARVQIHQVKDILTIYSIGKAPAANVAKHTYILTHGVGGVDERFFDMGQAIVAKDPDAQVLVVDWSPGADRRIAKIPNPIAAANYIDLTGDLLGVYLVKLHKKQCFYPEQATFIGESFGNCVNHRAALCLRKSGLAKPARALVLNPAPYAGYHTPVFTTAFKQSLSCVTDSPLDSRCVVTHKCMRLNPDSSGPVAQHTFGMSWLQRRIDGGDAIATLFAP
jgi:hypothetical protein